LEADPGLLKNWRGIGQWGRLIRGLTRGVEKKSLGSVQVWGVAARAELRLDWELEVKKGELLVANAFKRETHRQFGRDYPEKGAGLCSSREERLAPSLTGIARGRGNSIDKRWLARIVRKRYCLYSFDYFQLMQRGDLSATERQRTPTFHVRVGGKLERRLAELLVSGDTKREP